MKQLALLSFCTCLAACATSEDPGSADARHPIDGGQDVAPTSDGGVDSAADAPQLEAGQDANTDATEDVTQDAPSDVTEDASPDAADDATPDVAEDGKADTSSDGPIPCTNDDAHEPNNTASEATDLGSLVPGKISNLVACDQADWYAFVVPANNGLVVSSSFVHDEANLNLHLYRASDPSSGIRYSASMEDVERIQYDIFADETPLLLEVRNTDADESGRTSYDLEISFFPGGTCDDDAFEPNDTPAEAKPMTGYPTGVLCGDNVDYYDLVVGRAGPGTQVELVRGDIPLEATVYAHNETAPLSTLTQDDANNRTYVTFDSEPNKHYDLKLSNPSQQLTVPYSFHIVEGPPTNDTCENAIPLTSGQQLAGWTQKASDSYAFVNASKTCVEYAMHGLDVAYSLTIPQNECLTAVASSASDLSLYLLEDCTTRCCWAGADDEGAASWGQVVEETLAFCNPTSADQSLYLIVDSALSGEAADFDLSIEIGPDPTPAPSLNACYPDE